MHIMHFYWVEGNRNWKFIRCCNGNFGVAKRAVIYIWNIWMFGENVGVRFFVCRCYTVSCSKAKWMFYWTCCLWFQSCWIEFNVWYRYYWNELYFQSPQFSKAKEMKCSTSHQCTRICWFMECLSNYSRFLVVKTSWNSRATLKFHYSVL